MRCVVTVVTVVTAATNQYQYNESSNAAGHLACYDNDNENDNPNGLFLAGVCCGCALCRLGLLVSSGIDTTD